MAFWDGFPYSNFHEMNLDWIISKVKPLVDDVEAIPETVRDEVTQQLAQKLAAYYNPDNPPPYPVRSVEGMTGDVHLNYPVQSVNGKTGAVLTPFTTSGNQAIKTFDTPSNAQYFALARTLADGKSLEIWAREDGHISLLLRDAGGQTLGNWQMVNNTEIPQTGVLSVNNKAGVVVLNAGDVGAVPTTRTINGKPLSSSINLNASDVGAVPTTRTINGKALADNIDIDADSVGAVPTTRTINDKPLTSDITLIPADLGAVPSSRTINEKPLTSNIDLTPTDIGMGQVLFNGSASLNIGGTINIDKAIEGSHIYWVRLSYAVGIAVPSGSNYGLSIMASSYDTDKLMYVRLEPTTVGSHTLRLDYAYQVEFTGSGTVRRATFTPTIQHIELMY